MTNAELLNTAHTFSDMDDDHVRTIRTAHLREARQAPNASLARRRAAMARICNWELVRRAAISRYYADVATSEGWA